jgi:cation diffusion facilitator CzcD-associated flavoprotein CzcO
MRGVKKGILVIDIAIIGAGQSGLGLGLALRTFKNTRFQIFDAAKEGEEGPWNTTARMLTLRTSKEIPGGPCLEHSHLSFRTWYEGKGGQWDQIPKIPTLEWASYLQWFRATLALPVKNEWHLRLIEPESDALKLTFNRGTIYVRKVVLATGRAGFGGFSIPRWIHPLPRFCWYHTGERIDPNVFKKKKVCVIGCAASAFDVAAVALENGAEKVTMLMRRDKLPDHNPWAEFQGWDRYFTFPDKEKIDMTEKKRKVGTCVPTESIARVEKWKNFELLPETHVVHAKPGHLETNRGPITADLILLGTGYAVDISRVPELASLSPQIRLWGDVYPSTQYGHFPYLGPNFEFLEKSKGSAPHLKDIHCFNYGAFLSHGRIAGDIDVLPIGLNRLADCFKNYTHRD